MIKNNKWKLIVSSLIILLPMLIAVVAGDILPEEIAVHWGIDGEADGYMGATVIFLVLPLVLLAVHWLCMLLSSLVDKNVTQNKKAMGVVFWILPCISLLVCGSIFSMALGHGESPYSTVIALIAVVFIVIGNYLPKTTRNVTLGIKVKWALMSDENWNATHRFSGKLYVATGLLTLLALFLPDQAFPLVALVIILVAALLPVLYSYVFYRKQLVAGTVSHESGEAAYGELVKNKKAAVAVTVVMITLLLTVLPFIMLGGSIETTLQEDALKVEATFWEDLWLRYEDIDSVEYREDGVSGERIIGYGSAKLLLGTFRNEEFGTYTRYTYGADQPCIVMTIGARKIVLGAESEEALRAIYERICVEIAAE